MLEDMARPIFYLLKCQNLLDEFANCVGSAASNLDLHCLLRHLCRTQTDLDLYCLQRQGLSGVQQGQA